jgi:O-antigen/teichoic acid export membrane protein
MAHYPCRWGFEVRIVNHLVGQASRDSTIDATQQFRSQVGHISRHSGVLFAGTIFTAALGYLFKVYLARTLGAEALGVYALGITVLGFIGIFNTLGLPQAAVKFVAAYQAKGRFKELHALLWRGAGLLIAANVVFALLLLILGRVVAIHLYHSPILAQLLPLFALIMLFGVISVFYGKVLTGYRDLKIRTLIVNFIGSPLNMLIAVALISAGFGLRGYLTAQILSGAIIALLLLVAVYRFTPAPARLFTQSAAFPGRDVWSFSATMLGVGFMEFVMGQVDKIALGTFRGAREVGIYSVAAAVVVYVPIVLSSVNQIFAPTIADQHARGERELLARLFQSLTKWVLGLTLPLALVVIIFARPLMRIFGPDFEAGWLVLIIGAIGQLVNCGVGSVGYLLLMSGLEKRLIKVQTVMAVVMVVASVAMVPLWGIYGAAAAAAITNIGVNVCNLLQVRKGLGLTPYNRSYAHLILPTAATLAIVLLLKKYSLFFHHNWLAVLIALVVAYVTFASIFLLSSGLDADDRLIASAIRSRFRGALAGFKAEA